MISFIQGHIDILQDFICNNPKLFKISGSTINMIIAF